MTRATLGGIGARDLDVAELGRSPILLDDVDPF